MSSILNKDEAKAIVDQLPDGATWDDLMHELYVRQRIEAGLEDSRAGRVASVSEVRERYGLKD